MLKCRVGPSWNEPDGQCGRNLTVGILCDTPSFLAYYDATAAGLMLADQGLFYGGPASDGAKKFLYALVQHCLNGTNAITGERGCGKVDFFSAHLKVSPTLQQHTGQRSDPVVCGWQGDQSALPITTAELPIAETVAQMIAGTDLAGTDASIIERRPALFFLGHISPIARFFAIVSLFSPS